MEKIGDKMKNFTKEMKPIKQIQREILNWKM